MEKSSEKKDSKKKSKKNTLKKAGKWIVKHWVKSSIIAIVIIVLIVSIFNMNLRPEVDSKYLYATLEKSHELIASKLKFSGISEFHDTGIPIINRSDFKMTYHAEAQIGVKTDEIKIEKNKANREYIVTVPKAQVLSIHVDPKSIEYFDTHFALLNTNEKEDGTKALELAEGKAKQEVADMGVLRLADSEVAKVINDLLEKVIPEGYKLKIVVKEK